MSDWTEQPDGNLLPSAELVDHIRSNRTRFPNAVADFAKITGKTEEEVQSIFDNEGSYFGIAGDTVTNLAQGALAATATAAENLIPAETLGDGAKAVRDFAESMDPKFETQKGLGENLTEGAGMAIPAIAATVGTGGWAGVAIGAGVSTLTMDSDATIAAQMEQVAPGITPDILVPHEGDSEEVKTLKALAANTVADAVSLGAFAVAGMALRGLSKAVTKAPVDVPVAQQVLEGSAGTVTTQAVKQVEAAAAEAAARKVDAVISAEEAVARTAARERDKLVSKINGKPSAATQGDAELRDRFVLDATASADRLLARSSDVAAGVTRSEALPTETRAFLHRLYDALDAGDDEALVRIAREGITASGTVDNSYAQTVVAAAIRQTLRQKGIGFEEMVRLVRSDPSIATRPAAAQTLKEVSEGIVAMTELDRHLGSAASYQLNYRKGLMGGTGQTVEEAEKHLTETFGEDGISLFADRFEFISGVSRQLEESGVDVVKLLPQLDDMFLEFDKARQGALANLKDNMAVRLSSEEKAKALGSTVRMIKDLQTTALLSQFSTTGMDVLSNSFNNLLLPVMEHGIANGNWTRAGREYAGYVSGFAKARDIAVKAWKKGEGVLDDFDVTDQSVSKLSYSNFPLHQNPAAHLGLRIAKVATDAALASSEFWKAARAQGVAYADGLEMGLASGLGRRAAKRFARQYVEKQFNSEGRLINALYRADVAETSWQSAFDTRYVTGKVGQAIDNVRNRDDVTGLLARSAMPFFRTLVNIGSNSLQFLVPPGTPAALRLMAKEQRFAWLNRVPKTLKALDDFTGANGLAAQSRAVGRHRLGMAATLAAYGLVHMSDSVEITGASGFKRWDARKRAFEEYPPNSLIIDGTAFDLSRLLPFSAPLMLVGMMRDMEIESEAQLVGGNYSADNSAAQALVDYGPALALTNLTLFQDSSAMQGVFNLFDVVQQAQADKNLDALTQYAEKYAQQYTPGIVKMAAKNANTTQYEGYDFFSRYAAAAGLPIGLPKLDFVGDPLVLPAGRGIDPFNRRHVQSDDPLHREFAFLNKLEGLAMVPPKPDMVFDARYWEKMGIRTGGLFSSAAAPSLYDMETKDGQNAWVAYRDFLYHGRLSADDEVSTGSQGDGIDIGKVLVLRGENFKEALQRITQTQSYDSLTPDARAKVWNGLFAYFRRKAKEQMAEAIVISPNAFADSRYGAPYGTPATLADVFKGASSKAAEVQRSRGSALDAAFSIKR